MEKKEIIDELKKRRLQLLDELIRLRGLYKNSPSYEKPILIKEIEKKNMEVDEVVRKITRLIQMNLFEPPF